MTTILFDNQSYAILNIELGRVGAGAGGPRAQSLLDLSNPDLDFVALAKGMGVDAIATEHRRGAHRRAGALVRRARPAPDRRPRCPARL